jgi:RNA polymerase sigma-70 factor (ECF subfamily)
MRRDPRAHDRIRATLDEVHERIRAEAAVRRDPATISSRSMSRLDDARAAWPALAVPVEVFAAAVAARPDASHLADLYLAIACAEHAPGAVAVFEQHCGPAIDRALASSGATLAERADLGQVVRQRLLVEPASGGPPRIGTYSGRGTLASWVRVVVTREVARMLPRERREPGAADDELAGLVAPDDDPEVGYLKRLYRAEFKAAFAAAVDALADEDRLLLRQHALDGLGIDQLAAQYGIHRATAARRVTAAREALVAATQRELIARLQVSRTELASLVRLIHSQLDVSLPRLLRR